MILNTVAHNFWNDLKKKELLVVKLFYTLMTGAQNTLMPYLTIHLRSLGITFSQTAVIYSILSVVTCVGPSLTGYLADRFGRLKLLAGITLLLSALCANCLLLVPAVNVVEGEEVILNLTLIKSASKTKTGIFSLTGSTGNCSPNFASNITIVLPTNCFHGNNATVHLGPPEESGSLATVTGEFLEERGHSTIDGLCWVAVKWGTLCQGVNQQTIESSFTLWLYFCVRIVSNVMLITSSMFSETLCLLAVQHQDGDYGMLQIWGAVGTCIFSYLAGLLMADDSYAVAFYIYGALKVTIVGLLYFFPMCHRPHDSKLNKNVCLILRNGQAVVFLAAMLCAGLLMGFLESYLFVFLDESLQASKSLMGLTVLVAKASGIPFYFFATPFIKRFGHVNLLVLGFAAYAIRYLGFSLIQDPYWCLPYEFLEAFTSSLMLLAAITYASHVSPPSVLATIEGMWAGLYFILGKYLGGVVGGLLYEAYGARLTFRYLSAFSVSVGTSYALFYHFVLKKRGTVVEQEIKRQASTISYR